MSLDQKSRDFLKDNKEDCGQGVYTIEVLSLPQVGFPFPGEPEINVIGKISRYDTDEVNNSDFFDVGDIVVMICGKAIPPIGQLVHALYWYDFYKEKRQNGNMRSCAGGRFAEQDFDSSTDK